LPLMNALVISLSLEQTVHFLGNPGGR